MNGKEKNQEKQGTMEAKAVVVPEEIGYVEAADAGKEERLASEINMITAQTKQMLLFGTIEIGRRLVEAKKIVKHGQWSKWLKERVDYSQRTANNFMKIYEQYGESGLAEKSQTIANLSYTQALTLLEIPKEERERFVEENDPRDLTIRELKEKVASLASEKSTMEAQLAESRKKHKAAIEEKEKAREQAEADAARLNERIQTLKGHIEEAAKNSQKDIEERLRSAMQEERAKLEEVEKESENLRKEIASLQKQQDIAVKAAAMQEVKQKDEEIRELKKRMKAEVEKASAEAKAAKEQYEEEQAKNQVAGELAKGAYLIDDVLDGYASLMDLLISIRRQNRKEGERLINDLEESMGKIREKAKAKAK